MRLLRRADQVYIAKRLAAIYYIAVHWRDDEWPEFVEKIVSSVADIAFRVGGEHMMTIDVPALVMQLQDLPCSGCETNDPEVRHGNN